MKRRDFFAAALGLCIPAQKEPSPGDAVEKLRSLRLEPGEMLLIEVPVEPESGDWPIETDVIEALRNISDRVLVHTPDVHFRVTRVPVAFCQ